MNAAPTIREIEQRAATFGGARTLITLGVAVVSIAAFGAHVDAVRAREADGAIRVLERQTAAAQKERHAATLAAIAAKRELAAAKAHADSLEAISRATKKESDRLAQLVHIASETTLVAAVTPDSTIIVSVPRVVTSYIQSLYATIQAQDRTIAARDTQTVRADTVIVTQNTIVHADSAVIGTQAATITEEKRARPRFGFWSGVSVTALVAIVVHVVF